MSTNAPVMNDATRPTSCQNHSNIPTVSKLPSSESQAYFKATLEERRSILRGDISCSIPELSTEIFLKYLLPPLRDRVDVKSVISSMRNDGLIGQKGEWKAFDSDPAATQQEREEAVFEPLMKIWQCATTVASRHASLEPTFALSLHSTYQTKSRRIEQSRPDGYLILREAEERAQRATSMENRTRWWYDIALTTEFKKTSSLNDRNENISKLMFNIQRTMTFDPCRRFTLGVTAEGTSMRLWFCSRATPVVSEPFDFTKDMQLLIHIFLSLAFASKEELGWDPTMRPILRPSGERVYEINVGDETYETQEVLSESSAEALVSHATRVWKVKHVESGVPYVLKDVWVEDDKLVEHDVRELILRDIGEKYGTDGRKEAETHLLTPVAHCVVAIDGKEDHTTDVMMRGLTPSMRRRFKIRVKKARGSQSGSSSNSSETSGLDIQVFQRKLRAPFPRCLHRRKVFRRKHYRIVFKEIAGDLYTVAKLSDAFTVLRDGTKALKLIHGSGWVHRDISPGNLYMYGGRGLIGDLEYCKRRNSDVANELRTGTVDFMAAEAMSRIYRHCSVEKQDEIARLAFSRPRDKGGRRSSRLKELCNDPPFFHNDLHDLESVWWVAIWELFNNPSTEIVGGGEELAERKDIKCSAEYDLFHAAGTSGERSFFLENGGKYGRQTSWLPDGLWDVRSHLSDLRVFLVRKYKEFEVELPAIKMDKVEGIHDFYQSGFEGCIQCACEMERGLLRMPPAQLSRSPLPYDGRDLSIPSLERDSASDSSSSNFEVEDPKSTCSIHGVIEATEQLVRERKAGFDDFSTPMPSLCVSGYELEVC